MLSSPCVTTNGGQCTPIALIAHASPTVNRNVRIVTLILSNWTLMTETTCVRYIMCSRIRARIAFMDALND